MKRILLSPVEAAVGAAHTGDDGEASGILVYDLLAVDDLVPVDDADQHALALAAVHAAGVDEGAGVE